MDDRRPRLEEQISLRASKRDDFMRVHYLDRPESRREFFEFSRSRLIDAKFERVKKHGCGERYVVFFFLNGRFVSNETKNS